MIKRELTTLPVLLPVSVQDAKDHLVIEHKDDDELISSMIAMATDFAEQHTGRSMMAQIHTFYLDSFTSVIELDVLPVQSVVVKYDDIDNIERSLPEDQYYADLKANPATIKPIANWPLTSKKPNSIRIEATAGYVDAKRVPKAIKAGILLHTGHLLNNREGSAAINIREVPLGVKAHLDMYKVIV